MNIILGSASKSRRRILERMGYQFKMITADINEKAIRSDNPRELVLLLARAKAEAILPHLLEPSILITADQVVFCRGKILEKPKSEQEARKWLKWYTKYQAKIINGIVLINTVTGRRVEKIDVSRIKLKPIPKSAAEKLVKDKNIFSYAGAFSVEDPLISAYIDYIDGTIDSIEGLPSELVEQLLSEVQN